MISSSRRKKEKYLTQIIVLNSTTIFSGKAMAHFDQHDVGHC